MASSAAHLREEFMQLVTDDSFIKKLMVHSINNRVHDFEDPLTSTLMIMVNSPLQLVICEAGILIFKSNMLPVFPFDKLSDHHCATITSIAKRAGVDGVSETYHGCGKHTVQVLLGTLPTIGKRQLLGVFVQAMAHQRTVQDIGIMRQLCNIILQRFLSSVSVPSDDIRAVMDLLWTDAP